MISTYWPHLLALLVGTGLTVQVGMNMTIARAVGTPLWASVANFTVGLVALLVTAVLLIWDLKRPDRFWFLLDPRKINRTSWLAVGGIFLGVGAAIGGLWFLAGAAGELGIGDFGTAIDWLAWPAVPNTSPPKLSTEPA